jgi:hypothetical protein
LDELPNVKQKANQVIGDTVPAATSPPKSKKNWRRSVSLSISKKSNV